MKKGKDLLKKAFKKEPEFYVPPNHYFDISSIEIAAKLGYKWFSDNAMIPLKPYSNSRIIIVPESYPNVKGSNFLYIHNDQVERFKKELGKIMGLGFKSYCNIKPIAKNKELIAESRKLKVIRKIARDLRDGFGMPEDNAKEMGQILFESKFSKDLIL
ncbi:MAG: hypothetical protein AB1571_00340 [Nanoarchaeota archaeon]